MKKQEYRVFTGEFRAKVAKRIVDGESVSKLQQEFQIERSGFMMERPISEGASGWIGGPAWPSLWRAESNDSQTGQKRGRSVAPASGGVGTQNRPANATTGFFQKSLQACKGVAPEQRQHWRDSIYQEIRAMMQREGF